MDDPARLASTARRFDLKLVVLFGSRARGDAGPSSDSDIAVLGTRGPLEARELLELQPTLAEATGLPSVDLVDLGSATPLLAFEISKDGRPLYEAEPGLFNLFRVRAWKLYLDDLATLRRLDATYIRNALARLTA